MQSFVQQDSWNHRTDSEAEVDHILLAKLKRRTPCNNFIDSPFDRFKIPQGPEDLATYGGVIRGLSGLLLVRIDNDIVHQHTGHTNLLWPQGAKSRQTFNLSYDYSAIVTRRQCLIIGAQVSAFMLHCQIATFVGGGRANNRYIWMD